jgi:hypothetical protein
MAKANVHLPFPLVSYNTRIAKLASNYNTNNVSLIRAVAKSVAAMDEIKQANEEHFCENTDLPLRKYPIQLDFLETLSTNDIEYWKNYIIIANDDNIEKRIKVDNTVIPHILVHEHSPEKRKRPNQTALSDVISSIISFKNNIEANEKGYSLIEVPESDRAADNIADEFAIVVDPSMVSGRFVDVMYETLWTNSVAHRDTITKQRDFLKKELKENIERICSFCVFKISRKHHDDSTDKYRICYLDGTCILTTNPLLTVFFIFAFGIRSFINKNEHNKLWVFNSIEKCLQKMKDEEDTFPITNYFSIIRSPPIKEIPTRFIISGWQPPFNPTYITLNRCNEVIAYSAVRKTGNPEEITEKKEEVFSKWNMTVFYRMIDGKMTMCIHRNFNDILLEDSNDFSKQRDFKHESMCIIAFRYSQIARQMEDDDIQLADNVPVSSSSDRVFDVSSPSKPVIEAPRQQQLSLPQTMIDDFLAKIEKMVTAIVQREVDKLRAEISTIKPDIIQAFDIMRDKDVGDIIQEFNEFGVMTEPLEKGLLDDEYEIESSPSSSSSGRSSSKRIIRSDSESSEEELLAAEEEEYADKLLDETEHKDLIDAVVSSKFCQRMTIRSEEIHSNIPLNVFKSPVMLISNNDIFCALLPPKKEESTGFDDDDSDDEDNEKKEDIIADMIVCRMRTKCATDAVGELTVPNGLLGYDVCIDYTSKEDKIHFLLPNSVRYNISILQSLLSLYEDIVKNAKNRKKINVLLKGYLEPSKLGKAIEEFPHRCAISICNKCYRREDKFIAKADEYTARVAKSKRNKDPINDVMYLEIYRDIKDHVPEPLPEDYFDPNMEWCFNCNFGFYHNDAKGRKKYIQISEDISKMMEQTRKIHYSKVPFHNFPIFLEIPIVKGAPNGAAFCSNECETYFKKRITNLKKFITLQAKKQSK